MDDYTGKCGEEGKKKGKSKRIERIGLFTAAESGLPKQV